MRPHIITLAASAVIAILDGNMCTFSTNCLKVCKHADFKVATDLQGQPLPQLICAQGIVDYSRKQCLPISGGTADENTALLRGVCRQSFGIFCNRFCVTLTEDPGRFDENCRGLKGVPETTMEGLTKEQAEGKEECIEIEIDSEERIKKMMDNRQTDRCHGLSARCGMRGESSK